MNEQYKEIKINNWYRKDQYNFFKDFDDPFFNITTELDVTELYAYSKSDNLPFFYCTLYFLLKSIHNTEEFKLRIEGDRILNFNQIDAGVTILKEDNSFMYCTIHYRDNLHQFIKDALADIQSQKLDRGFIPHTKSNIAYFSALPWISFTGFKHARKNNQSDSIPRFIIGKFSRKEAYLKMPLSVEVNHALADGFHVASFLNLFQELINNPEKNK